VSFSVNISSFVLPDLNAAGSHTQQQSQRMEGFVTCRISLCGPHVQRAPSDRDPRLFGAKNRSPRRQLERGVHHCWPDELGVAACYGGVLFRLVLLYLHCPKAIPSSVELSFQCHLALAADPKRCNGGRVPLKSSKVDQELLKRMSKTSYLKPESINLKREM
jgi:hypothetical protein